MTDPTLILDGRGLVESPRWHDGRLWFADWTAGEILRLAEGGAAEVMARAPAPPLSFDFDAEGRLLVVSSAAGELLRQGEDGRLDAVCTARRRRRLERDRRRRARQRLRQRPAAGAGDAGRAGRASRPTDFAFPNGMAVTPDNATLIFAESYASRLTAFDIAEDGSLSHRRVWAELDGPPDGICIDGAGAVWVADVPNARCRRVREGGEVLDDVKLDRGAFACMLGGPDRKTLYITAARWFGMDRMGEMGGTGQVLSVPVSTGGVGWP